MTGRWLTSAGFVVALSCFAHASAAEKKYSPGVSDTEIKIGQTMPYSGPVSVYGQFGRAQHACFAKINDQCRRRHLSDSDRRLTNISPPTRRLRAAAPRRHTAAWGIASGDVESEPILFLE